MSSANIQNVVDDPCFSIFLYIGVNDNRFPESVTQQLFHDLYVERNNIGEPPILQNLCVYYTSLRENQKPGATRNPDLYRTCAANVSN